MRLRTLLLATMLVGTSLGVSEASLQRVSDPKDAPGRLDVRTLTHTHGQSAAVLQHRLRMDAPWNSSDLRHRRSIIYFWFSTDDEHRFGEFRAVVDFRDGRLVGCLQIYEEEGDAATVGPCDPIRVWRAGDRGVVIAFEQSKLSDPSGYRWSAETFFFRPESVRCSENECEDDAPDGLGRGRVLHHL